MSDAEETRRLPMPEGDVKVTTSYTPRMEGVSYGNNVNQKPETWFDTYQKAQDQLVEDVERVRIQTDGIRLRGNVFKRDVTVITGYLEKATR